MIAPSLNPSALPLADVLGAGMELEFHPKGAAILTMEPQLIPPVRAVLREFSRAGCSGRVLLDIEGDPDATYEKVVVEFSAAMPPVEAMAMSDRAEDRLNEEFPTLAHRIIPIVFSR